MIEYEAMALPDAYILLSNYRSLVPPPRTWVYALVKHYGLDHTKDQILEKYLPMHMAMQCARSIHLIDQGIYISNIEAMRDPTQARDLGIEAVLRVDDHNRALGQWPSDFILCDLPMRDAQTTTPKLITTATRFIHQQVAADRRNLIEYAGLTLAEAAWLVVRKRPLAEPHPALLASLAETYKLPYTAEQVRDWGFFYRLTVQ